MSDLPLPKRQPDLVRPPATAEARQNISRSARRVHARRQRDIADYEYRPIVGLFYEISSGEYLIADEVNGYFKKLIEGMTASAWLRAQAKR